MAYRRRVLPTTFRALRVPRFPQLLAVGWLWGLSRWGTGFLGGYLARELADSARLIQLTGVALWAPLLLGGVAGGVVADRLNRRTAIIVQFVVVAGLATVLGVVDLAGALELWMVYPFLVVVGTGWVIDMTCRRTIVYELVGPETIDNTPWPWSRSARRPAWPPGPSSEVPPSRRWGWGPASSSWPV